METVIKTIYLTLIHAALAVSWFLYTSDTYTLARVDHSQEQLSYNSDDYNALLDGHLHKRSK